MKIFNILIFFFILVFNIEFVISNEKVKFLDVENKTQKQKQPKVKKRKFNNTNPDKCVILLYDAGQVEDTENQKVTCSFDINNECFAEKKLPYNLRSDVKALYSYQCDCTFKFFSTGEDKYSHDKTFYLAKKTKVDTLSVTDYDSIIFNCIKDIRFPSLNKNPNAMAFSLPLPNMNNVNQFQNNIKNDFHFNTSTSQVTSVINNYSTNSVTNNIVNNHINNVNNKINNSINNFQNNYNENHSSSSNYSYNHSSNSNNNENFSNSNNYGRCRITLFDKDLIFKDDKSFSCNARKEKCKIEEELSKDLANDVKKIKVENCDCDVKLYKKLIDRKNKGINFFEIKIGETAIPSKKQSYNKIYAKCFTPENYPDNNSNDDGDVNQPQEIYDDWSCDNQNVCKIKAKSKNFNYEQNKSFKCLLSNGMCLIDRKLHKSLINDVQNLEVKNCDCVVKLYKDNDKDVDKYSVKKNFYEMYSNDLIQVNGGRYNKILIKCQASGLPKISRNYDLNK